MKWIGKHPVFSDLLIGGVLLTPPDNQYSYELTLPNDDGTSGQVLSTDGNGLLTWIANGVAVPNALTAGTGFDFSSGAGSWDGSIAETISIDWTEFSSISIGPTDNAMFYIRRSPNSSAAAGGDFELRAGNAGSGTDLAAGDIELHTGLGRGSGTAGLIKFYAGMNTTSGTDSHSGVINSYMASTTAQNTFTINEPGATNNDTLEFKVAAHGASTITTVDAAAAAANLDFVIDGQFSIASTGIDISGAGVISSAEWQGTDVAIAYGGTGQSTAQAAIDALSAVSGASTNECLIKDGSGNATWAAQTNTTYSAGDGLDLSGTTFSTDLKSNGGLVIESTELAVDLGASSITGVLADGDVAQDLTIVAGTINNTPIGASTANTIAGTTIDASTDFTVGTTVITDDQIQFTPSAGDTVTMLAGNNGAFNITCTDASGAKQANLLITADGTAEITAPGDITLDSALDIELEPGAADKYVNNVGIFRGGNIGPISDTFIPVMPVEFGFSDSYRNPGQMLLNGRIMAPSADRNLYYAQKIIPKGYTASACLLSGVDADGDARFICYQGDVSGTTPAAVSSSTAINSTATFTANIVGDGLKYCTIEFDPGDTTDTLYGAKITIAKT